MAPKNMLDHLSLQAELTTKTGQPTDGDDNSGEQAADAQMPEEPTQELRQDNVAQLQTTKPPTSKDLIAVSLTEEQARLLISTEYPNDIRAQTTALYNIVVKGRPVDIMHESIALDYEQNLKQFYASLDRAEKPILEHRLTQLLANERRAHQPRKKGQVRATQQRDVERE